MREPDFVSQDFGWITRIPGDAFSFPYFLPRHLPRTLPLDGETVLALSSADLALGQLAGLGQLVREPELLLGPSLAQDALSSSRIEGTQASLSDVLSAEGEEVEIRSADLRKVSNYLAAARRGQELLADLPLS